MLLSINTGQYSFEKAFTSFELSPSQHDQLFALFVEMLKENKADKKDAALFELTEEQKKLIKWKQ